MCCAYCRDEFSYTHNLLLVKAEKKNFSAGGRYIRCAAEGVDISTGSEMLGFPCFPTDSYFTCMYAWSAQGFIYFCWLNSNKRIIAEVFAIKEKQASCFSNLQREKIYNHYYPVPKTRKNPGAGGLRVRRASAM